MTNCKICGTPFPSKKVGVSYKMTCSDKCSDDYKRERERKYVNAKRKPKSDAGLIEEIVHSHFYSLVKPAALVKKRPCLKCGHMMRSTPSNRICSACETLNSRVMDRQAVSL
jgi:hypothetical protein